MKQIDQANLADLNRILQWLKKDRSGFYGNRQMLRRALDERKLVVYRDGDDVPAFLANGISRDGILAVREDARGGGFGGTLARYGIEQEVTTGICILDIECSPETSIPFWQHFGFTTYTDSPFGYRLIDKSLTIPQKSLRANVEIELYSADQFFAGREPSYRLTPTCALTNDRLFFAERTILSQRPPVYSKLYARIFVNGTLILQDQLGHQDAEKRGIKQDQRGNFYVEAMVVCDTMAK